MMTASGPELPEIDQRVVLTADVDRFPDALVSRGATGTVVHADEDRIHLRLDVADPRLAAWDNALIWYRGQHCEPDQSVAEVFWSEAEPEAPAPAP